MNMRKCLLWQEICQFKLQKPHMTSLTCRTQIFNFQQKSEFSLFFFTNMIGFSSSLNDFNVRNNPLVFHISTTFGSKLLWKLSTFDVIYVYSLKSYGIIIVIYSNRNHRNFSFLGLKRVVNAFIKSQQGKKRIFTHFQSKVFENLIWKNNFQRSNSSEYVSNMSHMIKIIILYGLCTHSEAYGNL